MSTPSSYPLSTRAAAQEARWEASRLETKAYGPIVYPALLPGRQDGGNFRTNAITVTSMERYADAAAARGAALGLTATYACVNLLAGTIGSLPLMVYRTAADGTRSEARDHPLYWLLHDSPNYDQTSLDFWEFMAAAIELQGNAYATMDRRADGFLTALTPIRPDAMQVTRDRDGVLRYQWNDGSGRREETQDTILHIRGFGGNPLGGMSPLTVCRLAFQLGLSIEQAANALFANGARPGGVLSTDKMLGDQRPIVEGLLNEKFMGAVNAGRPMLLDNGLKWEQITLSAADSEMAANRKLSGEDQCRLFGVPPAMVGFGDKSSNWGTGKEVDVLGFQKFTLGRRCKRIEKALIKQLLSRADQAAGITIEFNMEGLLRADSAGRSTFYASALQNGWMTINEVRRLENLPPVPGGDVPRMQTQNQPIDAVPGNIGGQNGQ